MTKLDFIKSVYFDEHTYRAEKAESLNAQGIDGGGWDGYSVARAFENAGMTAWAHDTTFGAFELDA